jgi:ATP-dependent protease HslVU (ClpYQ) peptidase subunit
MTVIAWDGKTLAADTLINCGDFKTHQIKIFKHGDFILGGSGCIDGINDLRNWFINENADADKFPYDSTGKSKDMESPCNLLVCRNDGVYFVFTTSPHATPQTGNYAIGSGAAVAMAIMKTGESSEKAVQISCEICTGCGIENQASVTKLSF